MTSRSRPIRVVERGEERVDRGRVGRHRCRRPRRAPTSRQNADRARPTPRGRDGPRCRRAPRRSSRARRRRPAEFSRTSIGGARPIRPSRSARRRRSSDGRRIAARPSRRDARPRRRAPRCEPDVDIHEPRTEGRRRDAARARAGRSSAREDPASGPARFTRYEAWIATGRISSSPRCARGTAPSVGSARLRGAARRRRRSRRGWCARTDLGTSTLPRRAVRPRPRSSGHPTACTRRRAGPRCVPPTLAGGTTVRVSTCDGGSGSCRASGPDRCVSVAGPPLRVARPRHRLDHARRSPSLRAYRIATRSVSAFTNTKNWWPSSSIAATASSSNIGSMAKRLVLTIATVVRRLARPVGERHGRIRFSSSGRARRRGFDLWSTAWRSTLSTTSSSAAW